MEIRRCNVWWVQWMNQNFPVKRSQFCLTIKETWADGRWRTVCWLIPDTVCRALLSLGLTGSSTLVGIVWFSRGAHNRGLTPFQSHHIYITTFFRWRLAWIKCGWWWFISLAPWSLLFYLVEQYPLFIVTLPIPVLKMSVFIRGSCVEVWSRFR